MSAPVGLAALTLRVPLVLSEADSHLGLSNRLLAPFARRVCLAVPDRRAATAAATASPADRSAAAPRDREAARRRFGIPAEATLRAGLRRLARRALDQPGGGEAFAGGALPRAARHAGGATTRSWPRAELPAAGYDLLRVPRPRRLRRRARRRPIWWSRAPADRCSSSPPTALPAILVPYPHAAADHQSANARWMGEAGAAVAIADAELTGPRLAARGRGAARRPRSGWRRWRRAATLAGAPRRGARGRRRAAGGGRR